MIIVDVIIIMLAINFWYGFRTGRLDWLILWYGCAPTKEKSKMNGDKILGVASNSMAIIAALAICILLSRLMHAALFSNILYYIIVIVFIVMNIWTFKLSRDCH